MTDPPDLLFVYGTLTSRHHNAPAVGLRKSATLLGPATYQGRMYLVRGPRGSLTYPAVVASDDPGDRVYGELYRLDDAAVIERLDRYEGCAPDTPLPHEYRREVGEVLDASGAKRSAYVYLFARSTDALPRIASGVFSKEDR